MSYAAPTRAALTTLTGFLESDLSRETRLHRRPLQIQNLESWTKNGDPGVRYFSGSARYMHSLEIPSKWLRNRQRVELDLGAVKNLAEIWINGKSLGVLWKPPFRIDVTDAVHVGSNRLEVAVTNTWVNRLIGDKQPGSKALRRDDLRSLSGRLALARFRPAGTRSVVWTGGYSVTGPNASASKSSMACHDRSCAVLM